MRALLPDEIECRVGQKSKDGSKYSVLLYKTSRTDMKILDETYGEMYWKSEYSMVGSSLFCTIYVYDNGKGEWIGKMSNGSESNIEAEKGCASDAMKRAGFLWGIGRELYSAPQIWLKSEISPYSLSVGEIESKDGYITYLSILSNGTEVFKWGSRAKKSEPKKAEPMEKPVSEEELNERLKLVARLEDLGADIPKLLAYYKCENLTVMPIETLRKAVEAKEKKSA